MALMAEGAGALTAGAWGGGDGMISDEEDATGDEGDAGAAPIRLPALNGDASEGAFDALEAAADLSARTLRGESAPPAGI